MSDRHLHCVYFQYFKNNNVNGICLLKNKEIEYGFKHCCENIVLKPSEILTYFLKHENYCEDWFDASEKSLEYLEKVEFNNYPYCNNKKESDENDNS